MITKNMLLLILAILATNISLLPLLEELFLNGDGGFQVSPRAFVLAPSPASL